MVLSPTLKTSLMLHSKKTILLALKLRPPSRHGPERTEEVARWQQTEANRRVTLVSILKGETSMVEAARTHGPTVAEVEDWREEVSVRGRKCAAHQKDEDAVDEQIKKLKQAISPGERYFTGGVEALPFGPEDTERRSCQVLRGGIRPASD